MNSDDNPEQLPEKLPAWKSPWFWTIIALVAIVLGVNILMAFFAVKSNPGLVSKDYYERGKSFANRTKIEFTQQNKLGWKMKLTTPEKISTGEPALFRLTIKGKDEAPVIAQSATLFSYRPSNSSKDFSVPMVHDGDGVYSARISFPLKGTWDIIAEIQKGETRQNLAQRIMVEDPL